MKKAMMEDMGKKGADGHKPKGTLIIEKEAIAIPKDKLAEELKGDEEGLPEESLEDKLAEGEEESPALEDSAYSPKNTQIILSSAVMFSTS